MILEGISSNKRNLFWTIAHIGIGYVSTITPFVLIGWFYLIFFTNISKAITQLQNKRPYYFFYLFSYLISFELLDRMAKTSPYLPFELGKYLLVIMGIMGILNTGIRENRGLIMAILVTPAVLYDFSGLRTFFDIINYYLGPLAVGLGIAFSHRLQITEFQLNQVLKLIWLTTLACVVFTYVKTPDLEDIEFKLGANFETTGGGSSNQVSTILGLGMFLSFYSIFKKLNFSGNRALDVLIMLGFTFQGLISFSRGGMMVAALGILLILFTNKSENKRSNSNNKTITIGIISLVAIYGVFELANEITGGKLLLRYQGETNGTLLGTKEVTADHFVTGRLGIFEKDIQVWLNHFFTGGGVGSSRFLRDSERMGVAPHVELSRLLADHGLMGLVYAIYFFIVIPINSWKSNIKSPNRSILMVLFVIAITSTFHAAMRTYVTPLFVILGSLKVTSDLKTNKAIRNT